MIAVRIKYPVLIRADNGFIQKSPNKTTRPMRMIYHRLQKIVQSRPGPAIIKSVHKFRWEKNIVCLSRGFNDIIIIGIMFGIRTIEFLPGMQHRSRLRVIEGIVIIQSPVPAALIPIVPKDYGGGGLVLCPPIHSHPTHTAAINALTSYLPSS